MGPTGLLDARGYEALLGSALAAYGAGDLARCDAICAGLLAASDGGIDPRGRALKLLGSSLLMQGRQREAAPLLARALAADPDDPYTLVALAELKLKSLALAEAAPLLERLFALDPQRRHPAANRGRQLVAQLRARLAQAS